MSVLAGSEAALFTDRGAAVSKQKKKETEGIEVVPEAARVGGSAGRTRAESAEGDVARVPARTARQSAEAGSAAQEAGCVTAVPARAVGEGPALAEEQGADPALEAEREVHGDVIGGRGVRSQDRPSPGAVEAEREFHGGYMGGAEKRAGGISEEAGEATRERHGGGAGGAGPEGGKRLRLRR